jgi:phosphate transport system substrate-binding protein
MKTAAALAILSTMLSTRGLGLQEPIFVGGAGFMIPLMQEVAAAFHSRNNGDRVEIMPNSLGTAGGVKGAQAGRLAIGLTARPPKPEAKGRLMYRRLGLMPVVVTVNHSVAVAELSEAQICGIFAGRTRSWKDVGGPDAPIVVLTRTADDENTLALREHLGCAEDLEKGAKTVTFAKATEMEAALATRSGTIGLTTLVAVLRDRERLRAVAINGVAPTPEAVRAGRYRLVKECGLVTAGEPDGVAKRFIDFVFGPDGQRLLTQSGLVATRAGDRQ